MAGSNRVIEPADPRGEDVRLAVSGFLNAIADADLARAEAMFAGDVAQRALLASLIEVVRATEDLDAALVAAFPEDERMEDLRVSAAQDMRLKAEGLYEYDPVIVGEAADGGGRYASSSPNPPFYSSLDLLERDGKWRVVAFGVPRNEALRMRGSMEQLARSARDVAAKAQAGKYATLDVAIADLLDGYGQSIPPPGPAL